VKEPKDCAPDAQDDKVPQETDGDVEVICSNEWEDTEDSGGDELYTRIVSHNSQDGSIVEEK
jgi:hypothetical protein